MGRSPSTLSGLHTSFIITKRIFIETIFSLGFYITLALATFGGVTPIKSLSDLLDKQGVIVVIRHFDISILISGVIISIYIGFCSLISICHDRDHGTLEVLFYAPINHREYLLGQLGGQGLQGSILLLIFGIYMALINEITGMAAHLNLVIGLFTALFYLIMIIALSIFCAVAVKHIRGAILLFLTFQFILIGIPLVSPIIFNLSTQNNPTFVFVSELFQIANIVLGWFSPFSFFTNGLTAIGRGNFSGFSLVIIQSLLFIYIVMRMSEFFLFRRGVIR